MLSGTTSKAYARDFGRAAPPVGVAVEEDFLVLHLVDELERACAYGVQAFVAAGAVFDYAEEAVAQVEEQRWVGDGGVDCDGERALSFDGRDLGERAAFRGDEGAVGHAADGPGDVVGGEGLAVVEVDAGAEVKDPGERVGAVPGGGEPGLEVEVLVLVDESVVDERADALGLGVGALAQVEVVGRAFDEEADGVGVARRAVAAGERQQR